jgi:hypothetical protein
MEDAKNPQSQKDASDACMTSRYRTARGSSRNCRAWRLAVPVWLTLECGGIYLDRGRCGRRQPTSVETRTTPRVSGHRHRGQRISEVSYPADTQLTTGSHEDGLRITKLKRDKIDRGGFEPPTITFTSKAHVISRKEFGRSDWILNQPCPASCIGQAVARPDK